MARKPKITATKSDIAGSILFQEIAAATIDSLWYNLALKREVPVHKEGAHGEAIGEGALFIPGGFIYKDSDGERIKLDDQVDKWTGKSFAEHVRKALDNEGATLYYPTGFAYNINLGTEFFLKGISYIDRSVRSGRSNQKIDPNRKKNTSIDFGRTSMPPSVQEVKKSRIRIAAAVAECIRNGRSYTDFVEFIHDLDEQEAYDFKKAAAEAQKPLLTDANILLAHPHVISCHTSRHVPSSITGLTRIMGYGKFGEFATFTIEEATQELLERSVVNRKDYADNSILASHAEKKYVGVLRFYPPVTKPGKRTPADKTTILSVDEDIGLSHNRLEQITMNAMNRYL